MKHANRPDRPPLRLRDNAHEFTEEHTLFRLRDGKYVKIAPAHECLVADPSGFDWMDDLRYAVAAE